MEGTRKKRKGHTSDVVNRHQIAHWSMHGGDVDGLGTC